MSRQSVPDDVVDLWKSSIVVKQRCGDEVSEEGLQLNGEVDWNV